MKRKTVRVGVLLLSWLVLLGSPGLAFAQPMEESPEAGVSQADKGGRKKLSKSEVMALSYEDLLAMDLDVLMEAADTAGMSMDDLLEMAMNRKATIASKKSESIFESPLATYVISHEDIISSGYTHVAELFNLVPGAFVRQKTNGNYDVTFHGMDNVPPSNPAIVRENTTMLLMIDGRIVYDQFSGAVFWETLPVSVNDIERIDVIVGAASALYGPNAMTGVVNIITMKSAVRASAKGLAALGLHGKRDAMLNVALPIADNFSARATGYFQKTDRFEREYYNLLRLKKVSYDEQVNYFLVSPFLGEWSARRQKLGLMRFGGTGNLYYDRGSDLKARLTFGAEQSRAQTAAFNNTVRPLNMRSSLMMFTEASMHIGPLHGQGSYSWGTVNLDEKTRTPYNTRFESHTGAALINGNFDVGYGLSFLPELSVRHTVVEDAPNGDNFDPMRVTVDPSTGEEVGGNPQNFMNGEKSLTVAGASLRLEYRPIASLKLIAAARYDLYAQIQRSALSWQAVASWQPVDDHLIRANYSRASRSLFFTSLFADVQKVPIANTDFILWDLGGSSKGWAPILGKDNQWLSLEGNRDLSIPKLDFYELGYRGKFGRYFTLDLVLFYQQMQDFDAPEVRDMRVKDFLLTHPKAYQQLHDVRRYENLGMKARQFGATLALSSVPTSWLSMRGHITFQMTRLSDYKVYDGVDFHMDMKTRDKYFVGSMVSRTHTGTPAIFGGLNLRFNPLPSKSLLIDVNIMGRTNQLYGERKLVRESHPLAQTEVDWGLWCDLSISYKVIEGVTVFATGQHLGREQEQYAFTDKVKMTALGGLRFDF
ncbi:MAG: hypothetical protein CSA97_06050 [Bacteroidetes bacterium]|nr:MAG: hypothetical protein CSA97_06050 [Bacteroidota bacterium]